MSAVIEHERLRIEPLGPALRQIAEQLSSGAGGALQLGGRDHNLPYREMGKTAIVINGQVGQEDALDVGRANAHRLELRAGFLLWLDLEARAEAKKWVPTR